MELDREAKRQRCDALQADLFANRALIIAANRGRRDKKLFTNREGGEPVRLHIAADERGEAEQCDRLPGHARRLVRTHALVERHQLRRQHRYAILCPGHLDLHALPLWRRVDRVVVPTWVFHRGRNGLSHRLECPVLAPVGTLVNP